MKAKLFIIALMVSCMIGIAVFADGDMFGSLAYNKENDAYGWAVDFSTQQEADAEAMKQCGDGCEVVIQFQNTCAAFALGSNHSWGWAYDNNKAVAQRNAVANCAKHGSGCKVKVWGCTTR